MMKAGTQQGFTLIELMIVIVIIGILTSVALPAYRDYVVRARAAELLVVADAAKMEVTEYITLSANLPGDDFNVQEASSAMVDSVLWEGGKLVVRGNAANLGAAVTLALTPARNNTGTVEWTCTPVEGGRYLPATCQE